METTTIQPTHFADVHARRFAGLEGHFTFATISEIPQLWTRFAPHIGSVPGQTDGVVYGLCYEMNDKGIQYLAAVEIKGDPELPAAFRNIGLPANHYAVFSHEGPLTELSVTINAIWHGWLPQSGKSLVDHPHMLERYDDRFDPATMTGVVEIWIPVKP
jgi:AraC family transcriptional regulator